MLHLNLLATTSAAAAAESVYRACKPNEPLGLGGVLLGQGLQDARAIGRSWCPTCEAKVGRQGTAAPGVDGESVAAAAPTEPPVKRRRAAG